MKVKAEKSFVCLIKERAMKTYAGVGIPPRIFNLGTAFPRSALPKESDKPQSGQVLAQLCFERNASRMQMHNEDCHLLGCIAWYLFTKIHCVTSKKIDGFESRPRP
jgi:hypothetical protein